MSRQPFVIVFFMIVALIEIVREPLRVAKLEQLFLPLDESPEDEAFYVYVWHDCRWYEE